MRLTKDAIPTIQQLAESSTQDIGPDTLTRSTQQSSGSSSQNSELLFEQDQMELVHSSSRKKRKLSESTNESHSSSNVYEPSTRSEESNSRYISVFSTVFH